jgi:protein-disulfide isomerase
MSKKSAREKLRAERERQAAQARRRENVLRIGIAVVVALVIVGIAGVVQWQRSQIDDTAVAPAGVVQGFSTTPPKKGESATPRPAPSRPGGLGDGVGVGKADAPVVVELFEDFSCPHCRDFEADAEQMVDQQVAAGKIRVIYYPMTLSQFGRPTQLSANAFACAADEGKAQQMHDALYGNFSQQWTNSQLVALGRSLGLTSGSFRSCVNDEKFAEWVRSIDQTATDRGVTGTPTIFVNGKQLPPEDMTSTGLRLAIDNAQSSKS